MSEQTHDDPVHRASYSFERKGEDLLVDCWLRDGGGLPPHCHPRQTETWWSVQGEVLLRVGSGRRIVGPDDGEQVVTPGTLHGLKSASAEEVHLRCRVQPALGLEDFLTESAAAARDGLFKKGGVPTGLRGARWAARFLAKHQDDVEMAFPPKPVQRAMVALFAR